MDTRFGENVNVAPAVATLAASVTADCSPKNLVFGSIWFTVIFLEITEKCVKERYLHTKEKIQLVRIFIHQANMIDNNKQYKL